MNQTANHNLVLHLRLDSRDLRFQVLLNDFPVFTEEAGLRCVCRVPINHHVVTGNNVLRVDFSNPIASSTCWLKIELIKNVGSSQAEDNTVLFDFRPFENTITPPTSQSMNFVINGQLPEWQWVSSKPISSTKETRESLEKEIQMLHQLYEKDDRLEIFKARSVQIREMALACNKPVGSIQQTINDELDVLRGHPEMALAAIDFDDARIGRYCDGRVVTLLDDEGDSLICFIDPKTGWCATIPAYFAVDANGEFFICR